MFATDRDLLILEPNLFTEVRWAAQTLLDSAPATISADGLTLTIPGVDLNQRSILPGAVAVLDGLPVEVFAVDAPTTLYISRPRARTDDPPIPVLRSPLAITAVTIHTFRAQIGIVHDQLLRALGIEPGAPAQPGAITESSITNPRAIAHVEALGALHIVFAAASALVGEESLAWHKARLYRERFSHDRRSVAAAIDLDHDGIAEAVRRINTVQLTRG